ncbi:hypothetical protein [Chthonobacter albigriseus]|uniref:hypothetical protein n=1 Tax=Chthonobacter albigriseus TaxID=1683161 RepID=UPI0015EE7324|nr:hypothetical protein [Chthonobacter albigriseus]
MTTSDPGGRSGASDQNTPTSGPADEIGRPEHLAEDGDDRVYGEPNGPRPPRYTILPKEVIEAPPAERAAVEGEGGPSRTETEEVPVRGYYGGMSTPETFETTGDQQPKIIRRDLETFREQSDADDEDRQVER